MAKELLPVEVELLNVEDRGSNVFISYGEYYSNGSCETRRKNVKNLGGYYNGWAPKPIVAAVPLGKVYCGMLKTDARLLFAVWLDDGSAQLIQCREGTKECLKLLAMEQTPPMPPEEEPPAPAYVTPSAESAVPAFSRPAEPYRLKKNELPQGKYAIGRDIPPGTYDFFVVYGYGGKFDIAKYDAAGKIVDGTWTSYWVGQKESYEHRELVHVHCPEGYTVNITGNVILKIAKSQPVRIEL